MSDDKPFDPNDILRDFNPRAGQKSAEPLDVGSLLDGWRPDSGRNEAQDAVPAAERPAGRSGRINHNDWDPDDVIDVAHIDITPDRQLAAEDLVIDTEAGWSSPQADEPIELQLPEVVIEMPTQAGELDEVVSGASHYAAEDAVVRDIESDWEPPTAVAMRRQQNPRLLAQWQPGAWTGAMRRAFGAATEIQQTEDGPVVDTFAPHLLLALWAPQSLDSPLLGRWPHRVLLSAVDADEALDALLRLVPAESSLWLTEADLDWALVADLALHHEAGLRPFQEKALREFADAQRMDTFSRINDGYFQPQPGAPVQPVQPAAGAGAAAAA